MQIREVIQILEELAPLKYAEDFDNVGLLVGDKEAEVKGVLVTLDTIEAVVDEAVEAGCNLIVSFHPIIFKGLKSLTGGNYVERTVVKAIKNDIAIFAIHTALDNSFKGVNDIICNKLGLLNKQILIPQKNSIKKLLTYVPESSANHLREALFSAGAGGIGNYDDCSFNYKGVGTFKGNKDSNPVLGERGKVQEEPEIAISVTFTKHLESKVLKAMFKAHPYEEVAYEIITLDNSHQHIGMGMIGNLTEAMNEKGFLEFVKNTMNCGVVRHSQLLKKSVSRVAVLGGSGSFAIEAAIAQGADVFISSDFKYHDFFRAEGKIVIADIGHYESEQFTKSFLTDYLSKKITNFAPALSEGKIILSKTNTNPVNYL
ncbi:Nif3-like dinuclear metal center hexameric protein [Winogradskyella aurantiaca]|uniref:Nif3-like dinuclear metal center hexameric protein n=1 Tax=Winogradskyella aurantiaca TaxID=2219558 RepID=UPI000E1E1C22|nr:Nif3-like dinuclear metal center hexameric protein [Winogradskyella aurantiaca]